MNAESLFGLLYIGAVVCGFVLLLGLVEGVFKLLYRFVPAFRCWYDKLDSDLPDCDTEG